MQRRITTLLGVTCLIITLSSRVYAQAPIPIGTITFIEGISDIVRNNQEPFFVSESQPVYVSDRIRTKSYSKIEITFADKSVLKLAPSSCVSIEEYRLNDKNIRELARINLSRGKIETIVSKTGAPDTFLIDTPNAKGAVKGSDIFISYLGGRTGVFAHEGAISVLSLAAPDMKTRVAKGNCVFVPFNEVPGEVRLARDAEMAYFKRSVEPEYVKKWIPSKGSTQMNAVIVLLSGDVRFYKKGAGDWREAKINETLSEGDKIQTGDDGMAEIRLSNGNVIMLQRNAELGFATLRYDQASGNYQNTFEMTKGKLSAVVENINKQCTFQVKTPASVCGVRGTFLEVVTAPVAAATQPATQAFFEGGSGYVTSTTTGQTQEVGPGQNVSVDVSGGISAPAYTTAEQRTEMFQAWTVTQTVGGYSTAQGATGLGSDTQQNPLPPAPDGLIQGGDTLASLNDEIKNFLDLLSKLTFDELLKNPLVVTMYDQMIPFNSGSYIYMATSQLTIYGDRTFGMTTNGSWSGQIEGFSATFINGADTMTFTGSAGPDYTWSGAVSGSIGSLTPNITFSGTISGTAVETSPGAGTYQGSGSGTWSEIP
jgi:hypothetical protein